ncbi:hypothetical protein QF001_002074 [Paraburkholderia youngii]|uniref:BPSL0067 family protein n=1 Tax=Paraburkholderia youngii TaxID=2782701 RepID=UPI003D21DED2
MRYVADTEKADDLINQGHLIGNGQCVTLVHAVVSIPPSSLWKRGDRVQGNFLIAKGTVIATFDSNGRYGNHTNGTSHAAIYLGQTLDGITVIDQWNGHTKQPPHRYYPFPSRPWNAC